VMAGVRRPNKNYLESTPAFNYYCSLHLQSIMKYFKGDSILPKTGILQKISSRMFLKVQKIYRDKHGDLSFVVLLVFTRESLS
jgi:hypothetical protein